MILGLNNLQLYIMNSNIDQNPNHLIQSVIDNQTPIKRYTLQDLDEIQSQSFIEGKKSPLKYQYLPSQMSHQDQRQSQIFFLQCFAMFIFIYGSTCYKNTTGLDLAYFTSIMMAIPICAKQTGANLNPSISFSMIFKGQKVTIHYWQLLWLYLKAQLIGATLSMVFSMLLNQRYIGPVEPNFWNSSHGPLEIFSRQMFSIFLSESLGVFILIFFILYGTGTHSFITNNGAKYFYIALFIYIGRRFAVSSGNQVNVALTFSQAVVGLAICNFSGFKYLIVWVLGDMFGVLMAASLYMKVVEPTLEYIEKIKTEKEMKKVRIEKQMQNKNKIEEQDGASGKTDSYKNYYKKLQFY